jgi:hypothetical protein
MAVGYNVNIGVKDSFKTGIFVVQCTNSTWSSWLKATGVLNRAGTTFSSRDKTFLTVNENPCHSFQVVCQQIVSSYRADYGAITKPSKIIL